MKGHIKPPKRVCAKIHPEEVAEEYYCQKKYGSFHFFIFHILSSVFYSLTRPKLIATTHLAVGAAVGLWSARLAGMLVAHKSLHVQMAVQIGTALIAGTVSHLVLDAIPHNDGIYETASGTTPVLIPELAIIFGAIFVLVFIRGLDPLIVFSGMVGAAWLDLFHMLGITVSVHEILHAVHKSGLIGSMMVQLLIIIVALLFLF